MLVPFLLTRALVAVVALGAAAMVPPSAAICRNACDASSIAILNVASRWDGDPYLTIARDGYRANDPSLVAYFPLYPFLMRMGGGLFGSDDAYLAAGVVISNLALFAALVYLARTVMLDHDAKTATRAVIYLLVFPTTVFLSAVYAESGFLVLAIAAMYHARRRDWLLAGALAALAALTRPFGAVVAQNKRAMALMWERIEMFSARSRAAIRRYLPQLKALDDREIHAPWLVPAP